MLSARKKAILTLGLISAILFSACNREKAPSIDYSGIKEIDKDELFSKATEEVPKETAVSTAAANKPAEETVDGPEIIITATEETAWEESAPAPTESAAEPPSVSSDPDKVYKEDKLLSTKFSEEEINYLHNCAFLGDSTCLGYCRYGFIADDRVFGNGGVAARNIHTHTFTQKGQEADFLTALKNTGCTELYFLMGMNDVRIISAEEYKENYSLMLREVKEFIPDADIHILSVTPITEDSDFYPNERLDLLNEKLREIAAEEGYTFIDTASAVRNEKGFLKDELCSGDGIHMVPEAYYLMLGVIFESAGV